MIKKITLSSVILAFIVVLLGAYIHLSGAQLACPDWPGCFGQVVVSDDADFKSLAAKAFPDFPVDTGNACLVMAHRYLTAFLALMLLALNLLSWKRQPQQKSVFIASTFLLALVFVQAFLNAWLVRLDAMPVIVTAHVFIGLVIFWQLYRLYLHIDPGLSRTTSTRGPLWFSRFAMLILLVQIVLGIWVSTNQAGQVCKTFLGCNEQGFSGTIYQNTFSYLREILSGYTGVISTDAQIAVLSLHRLGGLVSFIVLAIVLIFGFTKNNPKSVKNASLGLAALSLIQLCLVLIGMKLNMPPWITLPHLACSILLMLPLIGISFYSRYAYAEKQQPIIEFEKRPEPTPSVTVPVSVPLEKEEYIEPSPASLLSRLKSQLKRTRSGLGDLFASLPFGEKAINEDILEEIEAGLIMADVGIDTTHDIINRLTHQLERHQLNDGEALSTALKQELLSILLPCSQPLQIPEQDKPFVILVVGVNGAGKTTTIGKLAKRLQAQGKSVMLAAGDTFRAAAVEQLQVWGARNNIHVVAQHTGADSASVIYDGVQSALAKGVDVLIADTAGRLQTKSNLMDELKKVKRIMAKLDETAPHEVLLVLDAGTGQNALSQAKLFNETVALTGLVLTKLDGTAKGGVIFALAKQTGIPIRFIGIGEGIDDLQDFDAKTFVDALFVKD